MRAKVKQIPVGTRFGKWVVQSFSHVANRNKGNQAYWNCVCDCGTEVSVNAASLRKGNSTQCKHCSGRMNGRKGLYSKGQGDLYMIQCGQFLKIGVTKNIKERLTTIQSCCPLPVKLVGLWREYGHMEKEWHDKLKEYHVHGEWFGPFAGICEIN